MFAQYKYQTTLERMIDVSPHGAVTFVSLSCSGYVSDKELFRQSVPLLDKDMAVMVYKGFTIDDLVSCKVKTHSCLVTALVAQDISRLRVYVGRTIRGHQRGQAVIPLTIFVSVCLLINQNKQKKPLVKA